MTDAAAFAQRFRRADAAAIDAATADLASHRSAPGQADLAFVFVSAAYGSSIRPALELLGDLVQPFVELALRPRIERGERADDARFTLGNDQFGTGDNEQRGPDDGEPQAIEESGQGHTRFIDEPNCVSRCFT